MGQSLVCPVGLTGTARRYVDLPGLALQPLLRAPVFPALRSLRYNDAGNLNTVHQKSIAEPQAQA